MSHSTADVNASDSPQKPSKIPRPSSRPASERTITTSSHGRFHVSESSSPVLTSISAPRTATMSSGIPTLPPLPTTLVPPFPDFQQQQHPQPVAHGYPPSKTVNTSTEVLHDTLSPSVGPRVGRTSSPGTLNPYPIPPRTSSRTEDTRPLKHWETDPTTGVRSRRLPFGPVLSIQGDAERVLLGEERYQLNRVHGGMGQKVKRGVERVTRRIEKKLEGW